MRGTRRGKCHDRIGACNRPSLPAHCVGICARRNIHRDHRNLACVHDRDCFGVEPPYRRLEPRAQNGIDIQISLHQKLHAFTFQLIDGMHTNCPDRQLAVHDCSVAPKVGWVRQQDYLDLFLPFTQQARRHKTVAAIISLAAKDQDALCRSVMRQHIMSHGRPRILHQRERRYAKALTSSVVYGSHFFCADNLHTSTTFFLITPSRTDYKTKRPSALRGEPGIVREKLPRTHSSKLALPAALVEPCCAYVRS